MNIYVYKAAHEKEEKEFKAFASRTNEANEAEFNNDPNLIRDNSSVFLQVSSDDIEMVSAPTSTDQTNIGRSFSTSTSSGTGRPSRTGRGRHGNGNNSRLTTQSSMVNDYIPSQSDPYSSPNSNINNNSNGHVTDNNNYNQNNQNQSSNMDYNNNNESSQQVMNNNNTNPKSRPARKKKPNMSRSVSGLRVGKPILRNDSAQNNQLATTHERNHVSFL